MCVNKHAEEGKSIAEVSNQRRDESGHCERRTDLHVGALEHHSWVPFELLLLLDEASLELSLFSSSRSLRRVLVVASRSSSQSFLQATERRVGRSRIRRRLDQCNGQRQRCRAEACGEDVVDLVQLGRLAHFLGEGGVR